MYISSKLKRVGMNPGQNMQLNNEMFLEVI